jgi:hypothetical protein
MDVVIGTARYGLTNANFEAGTAVIDCPGITDEDLGRVSFDGPFHATFTVVFGKGQPLDGQPIVPTLFRMADLAKGVVDTCRRLFPGYVTTTY